jgi:putative membrane protein
MKSIFLLAGLVIGACAMQACENAKRNSNDPDSLATTMIDSAEMAMTDSMSRYQDDQASFIQQAALGSMMEVELGNLAKEQAANEKVKAFAAMVVRDHNKINAALKTLAASREVNYPALFPKKTKHTWKP